MEKFGFIGFEIGIIIFIVILYGMMFGLFEFPSDGGEAEYYQPGRPGISY